MRYLIDTHILIWYLDGNRKLADYLRSIIDNPDHTIVVSVVSLWELAIKMAAKKMDVTVSFENLRDHILIRNFSMAGISFKHLDILYSLPLHHGDPFDRMIISQAIAEELIIISVDKHFIQYAVSLVW